MIIFTSIIARTVTVKVNLLEKVGCLTLRISEKILIIQYINNSLDHYQDEVIELKQRLRYRNIDVNDCYELALAIERLAAFEKFSRDVLALLHIFGDSDKGKGAL